MKPPTCQKTYPQSARLRPIRLWNARTPADAAAAMARRPVQSINHRTRQSRSEVLQTRFPVAEPQQLVR